MRTRARVVLLPCALATLFVPLPAVARAQSQAIVPAPGEPAQRDGPTAVAVRTQAPPVLDGRLDDAAWRDAPPVTRFTQRDPQEGAPASEATEVRFVYDDQAIYIAGRFHDRAPVTTRLGRRDMDPSSSDWMTVGLDTFYDRRTAFQFEVNPSGVRRDASLSGARGDQVDLAWDAVWEAATSIDPGGDGWTAEMRIPFSQIGFAPGGQTWGLQIQRTINRNQELQMFAFTPKAAQGGVPSFGNLTGLQHLRAGRRLELLPYALGSGRFDPAASSLVGTRDTTMNGGLDARYHLTPNLTVTTTVNPDFGQVEVDPAVINLTAFETQYDEKRPFFVEGAGRFKFGGAVGGPSAAADAVLYSRRLGRAPQLSLDAADADVPDTARILAAAKLTGKTRSGWSVGVMNALTGSEFGRYRDSAGGIQRAMVEPRTNYFVGRISRDLRRGQSNIGAVFTSVNRDLAGDPRADTLRSKAYVGGLDFVHEWADRQWVVTGFVVGTHVAGSPEAMTATAQASDHYFQRPDARHLAFSPNATRMDGAAASINLRKTAGLHWITDGWLQMVTPGFEINDAGYLQRADRRAFGQGITYREQRPGRFFRDWSSTSYVNRATNYDGNVIDYFYWTRLSVTHVSYWQFSGSVWYEPTRTDDRLTRGGPLAMRPANWRYIATANSDPRRPVIADASFTMIADRAGSDQRTTDLTVSIRTSPRWNLSIGPEYVRYIADAQYVTAVKDPAMTSTFGTRYIFAPLDQQQLGLVTRFNYTFTPDLTLELYTQPLVSHGDYGAPKEFQTPSGYDFKVYGRDEGTITPDGRRLIVDPDAGGPLGSFSIPDRTFTTRSLRGNAVLRWEYRPGSTFYLVWQQNRLRDDLLDPFSVGRGFGSVFSGEANNTVALKWTYWFTP